MLRLDCCTGGNTLNETWDMGVTMVTLPGHSVVHDQGGQAGQAGTKAVNHIPALQPAAAEAGEAGQGGQLAQQGHGVGAQLAARVQVEGAQLPRCDQCLGPAHIDCRGMWGHAGQGEFGGSGRLPAGAAARGG